MNKIAFFTANINGYDKIHEHKYHDPDIDYFYFTDGNVVPKGYIHVKINEEFFAENIPNVQKARFIKANPWKYIPNADQYESIIWADACFIQLTTLKGLFHLMRGYELLTMEHPNRNCIYAEANVLIETGIGDIEAIKNWYRSLIASDYPAGNGLAATGIMVRRNTLEIKTLCETWEHLLSGDVYRDQLFFDYACWVRDIKYASFPFSDRGKYFWNEVHLGSRI